MFNHLRKLLRRKAVPTTLLRKLAPAGLRLETLVHVGAHLAQERHEYESCGYRKILWIEGSQQVHERLVTIVENHAGPAEHHTRCALLADRDGDEMELRTFGNDGMSSSIFSPTEELLRRWPNVTETGEVETILSSKLDTLLSGTEFANRTDVLVIDTQGAELLILQGGAETLASAKAVIAEVSTVPYYEGGVLFPEVNAFLARAGFTSMSTPRRHGDMLFLRNEFAKAA